MMKSWINDLNTTSYRIVWSVWLAAFCVVSVMLAMVIRDWEPKAIQMKLLYGIGIVLLTMMGFDVIQYGKKRTTDLDYMMAKNKSQPQQVNVAAPSTVIVKENSTDGV